MKFKVKLDLNKIFSSYAIFREEASRSLDLFKFEKEEVRSVEDRVFLEFSRPSEPLVEFSRLSTSGC